MAAPGGLSMLQGTHVTRKEQLHNHGAGHSYEHACLMSHRRHLRFTRALGPKQGSKSRSTYNPHMVSKRRRPLQHRHQLALRASWVNISRLCFARQCNPPCCSWPRSPPSPLLGGTSPKRLTKSGHEELADDVQRSVARAVALGCFPEALEMGLRSWPPLCGSNVPPPDSCSDAKEVVDASDVSEATETVEAFIEALVSISLGGAAV